MAKYRFLMSTDEGDVCLSWFDLRRNGLYLAPFPSLWGNTGFHESVHPGGTYFKTYKPFISACVGVNGLDCINHVKNYFQERTENLNVQEEPGIICSLNLNNLHEHVAIRGKNITLNAMSLMNSTGIAEVDNLKSSLIRFRGTSNSSSSLIFTCGMNSGTMSCLLQPVSMDRNRVASNLKGSTLNVNLLNVNHIRQLPFIAPFIAPMTQVFQGVENFLPRNLDKSLLKLSNLKPKVKLQI